MNFLPALTPKEVERILLRAGFVFIRQKGSHRIYTNEKYLVVVPWHNKDLKKGTLKSIIRSCGFASVAEFIEYLRK